MGDITWSASEKKIAQRVFDAALEADLAQLETKVANMTEPFETREQREFLCKQRADCNNKYDYRYAQRITIWRATGAKPD